MVQDREKLSEVGLEPDKPKGHVRAIWALTLILAFAIIIAGGVYFILWYSPWGDVPTWNRKGGDETKDWQTYENKTYDFTIKYPKDWEYKEFTKNLEGMMFYEETKNISATTWDNLVLIQGDIGLHFNKLENTLESNLAKFASEVPNCKVEDAKIAGKDGKKLNCPIEESGKGTTGTRRWYLVENNKVVFELFTADDTKKDVLDKMVGTWTFGTATVTPTSTASSSYSTYTERTRGAFSFEYPKDWQILKTNPYDADAEALEIVYKNGEVLNTSWIVIEDHKNETGTTDIRQAAGTFLPAANFLTDTTLGGKAAVKATGMEGMPPRTQYFTLNGGYLIIVTGRNYEGDTNLSTNDQKNKSVFEHIVQTWKWL